MKSILTLCVVALACPVIVAQPKNAEDAKRIARIERGKYLVEQVAQCVQCHSPREVNGELIQSKLLDGAAIPIGKPSWANAWGEFAPRIAGLPQYSVEQALKLLTTGIGKEGKPLRPPMPTFRMSQQDALEVIGYLKSLR